MSNTGIEIVFRMENGNFNNLQEGGKYYDKINTNFKATVFPCSSIAFSSIHELFCPPTK